MLAPVSVSVPPPCLTNPPVPPITPAKTVEFDVPAVRLLAPSATMLPATPPRSWIVWPPVLPAMSNVVPAAARSTPLDEAMLPPPESASVPALIVVTPL